VPSELMVLWDLEVVPMLAGLPALDRAVEMEGGCETGGELRAVFAWTVSSLDLFDGSVPEKKFGELVEGEADDMGKRWLVVLWAPVRVMSVS
jgi:hypothetical protein